MDKKPLLRNSLAKIMVGELPIINEIVRKFPHPEISIKPDGTPVTELDLALSSHIESLMEEHFQETTFYSEESFGEWKFPLLALDPLDGTREYIEGRAEWAISIGLFQSENFAGEGFVYNPLTKECFKEATPLSFNVKPTYRGEVSRSEWESGLFKNKASAKFSLEPVGSIAYKLGRLAFGKSDYVVSLRPKNIWDIAGGTLLCQKAGLKFYSQGKEVKTVQQLYQAPLIWCVPELSSELFSIYH